MRPTINPWRLLLLALLCAPAGAAEVYRWTDEHGQVHFSQRPPPHQAQKLTLPQQAPHADRADDPLAERRARQQRLLEAYEYEREREREQAAREAREADRRAQRCRELQEHWRQLSYAGPVYFRRDDGGRDYLSDAQRAAQQERLRPAYVEACGTNP